MAGKTPIPTPPSPEETAAAKEPMSVSPKIDVAPPPGLESFGNLWVMPKKIPKPSVTKKRLSKLATVEEEGSTCAQSTAPGTKRFCVYCGEQVPTKLITAKFCVYCGQAHSGQEVPNDMEGMPVRVPLPQTAGYSTPACSPGFESYVAMVQASTISNRAALHTFMTELAAQQSLYNNWMGCQSYSDDA